MSNVDPARRIILRGGVGTGKTSLCRSVVDEFRLMGLEAEDISLGWWFRAMISVALWMAGNMPQEELYRTASAYTGSQLVQAAIDHDLTIMPDGTARFMGSELPQPSGSALHHLIKYWGGDPAIRRYVIAYIKARMEQAPQCIFAIDSRSGVIDFADSRANVLSLYLVVQDPSIAASRNGCSVAEVLARDETDRHLPEGALLDPGPGDHVLVTDHLSQQAVTAWAIELAIKQFHLHPAHQGSSE